jgi:hypothetical protein
MSASALFHRLRNYAYASFVRLAELDMALAHAAPNFASGGDQLPTVHASVENF